MTAARADEPGTIPSQEWKDADQHSFRVLPTVPGDECVIATTYDRRRDARADVAFSPSQLREMAADFLERADHLDNVAARNRKTPRWHLREGQRLLRASANQSNPHEAVARAEQAQGHFLAAIAERTQTTVHIHHHHYESGKDIE